MAKYAREHAGEIRSTGGARSASAMWRQRSPPPPAPVPGTEVGVLQPRAILHVRAPRPGPARSLSCQDPWGLPGPQARGAREEASERAGFVRVLCRCRLGLEARRPPRR